MRTRDFHFNLPQELIAQAPTAERSASRLLVLDRAADSIEDAVFGQLTRFLRPGDCLVFNDTRVIPARLFGQKATGGKLEVLIERLTGAAEALAHIRCSKSPKPGNVIEVEGTTGSYRIEVLDRDGELFRLKALGADLSQIMQDCGHMPLPPYIEREDTESDRERYQTVYADKPGAVAAPTAGLHFDDALFERIDEMGVKRCFVTLHVGAGTFQPVRTDDITEHTMHSEYLEVTQETVDACRQAREQGGRIIAVGTTSVRCLETASQDGELKPYNGDTDIFIYPGYQYRSVDAMITNFHLPESTLLMLVSAFAGRERIMRAYQHAIDERYRFFSYGDAMLIA